MGSECMEVSAYPKKDGAWWCFVAYSPGDDYPEFYCYELRNGKLKPAQSPLDTYTKSHESMDALAGTKWHGKEFRILEVFSATYSTRVDQTFTWDGEKFTLENLSVNDGLIKEKKACFDELEKDEFRFDKFALVPAGGTLGLLLSDDNEEGLALFNQGPYDTEEPVQMLQCCTRAYGLFTLKFFEHGTVASCSTKQSWK